MIVKVKIKKIRKGLMTKYQYPEGYDAKKIHPFLYQEEGKNEEYCLAHADDDFKPVKGIEEITPEEAETLSAEFIDRSIAIPSGKKTEGKQKIKNMLKAQK